MEITEDKVLQIDFSKGEGLIPAIVQDVRSGQVLMLGYMNREAVEMSLSRKLVTFFSRSRSELWTKGETSGHFLNLHSIHLDCDSDTLLVMAIPNGPVCHTGQRTCFGDVTGELTFLQSLQEIIVDRHEHPSDQSYTTALFRKGLDKIAQKVGEEAVEVVIASKNDDKELFLGEVADLVFHLLVLLKQKDVQLSEVLAVLRQRHVK